MPTAAVRRGNATPAARADYERGAMGEGTEPLYRILVVQLAQARAGTIPHHRLGHYVRFRRSELEEWLGHTRLGPGPDTRRRS